LPQKTQGLALAPPSERSQTAHQRGGVRLSPS